MSTLIRKPFKLIQFVPVVSASSAYTAGDVVGATNLLSEAMLTDHGTALLQSVTVIDYAKQKAALTLFFFDDVPTLAGADNAAFDLTDAQMKLSCLGHVLVPAANYQDTGSTSEATVTNCGLVLRSNAGKNGVQLPTGATVRDIWCAIMTTGTPTYGGTSDLVVKLAFEQH